MSAIVKFYYTVNSKLAELPIVDGQVIFVSDTKKFYLDMNGLRLGYSDIQVLATDNDRTSMLAPVEGFYFVDDTNVLWRYKGGWKQVTPDNVTPIVFAEFEDFPPTGKENTLYVTNDATYRWDTLTSQYICIANKTAWIDLGE